MGNIVIPSCGNIGWEMFCIAIVCVVVGVITAMSLARVKCHNCGQKYYHGATGSCPECGAIYGSSNMDPKEVPTEIEDDVNADAKKDE